MATARVNIEADAWTDLRFAALARLLDLPGGHDHALILCAKIWSWQTAHYTPDEPTYVIDHAVADGVLGAGGAAALVSARLAEEHPNGLRIRGSEGRIEWLHRLAQNGRNSKPSRKEVAPAAAPAAAAAGHLPRPLSSLVQREDPDHLSARARAASGPADQERAERRKVQLEIRTALVVARREVAAELGVVDHGLLAQDPGERDLAGHLLAAGAAGRAAFREQALHAVAMAKLEASTKRELQWLTGAVFAERQFRRLVGMTAADARRAGPKSRAAPSNVGRVEPSEPSAYTAGDVKL